MDVNPFFYSRPISPDDIIDRDEETQKLLQWAVGGHFVRLFAPRKFGKTSLLGRVPSAEVQATHAEVHEALQAGF